MLLKCRLLALYLAAGSTLLMMMFPPFFLGNGDEYGFILTGPPSATEAIAALSAFGGQQGHDMARSLIAYNVDLVRLCVELAVVWGVYFALRSTVLRLPTA